MQKNSGGVLLSIIIPVYNVESFLSDCLNSVIAQGFRKDELQVICVNDGSTDNSLSILRRYEECHDFITVITKPNGGVSSARNLGLRYAVGKYICFLDSDDYVMPESYKKCIEIMEENQALSCFFNFKTVGENDSAYNIVSELTYHQDVKKSMISSSNVWGMILRRVIVFENCIFFNENMSYGEDTLFMYFVSLYLDVKRHVYIHEPIYYYRQRKTSAMHTKSKERAMRHMNDMLEMARCYSVKIIDGSISGKALKNTKLRRNKAVATAMFDAAKDRNVNIQSLLFSLKQEGLYPYALAWWTLKPSRSFNNWLQNLVSFLFPFALYYKIFTKIIRKFMK